MVNVLSKRCFHDSCTRRPTFNPKGNKTAAFCKKHAEDGFVNVLNTLCSHGSCHRQPSFGVVGSKRPAYCKQHADTCMLNVVSKRCSHDSCTMITQWGVLNVVSPTVCAQHKSDLPAGPMISFNARCKVAGCRKVSRWGLDGKQPTHCPDHGRLKDGLVRTVGADFSKTKYCSSFYGALRGAASHVKTECKF